VLTVTSTTTRPNASINWFYDTADGAVLQGFANDALIVDKAITLSEDGLTKVTTMTFNSYDDYHSWISKAVQSDNTIFLKRNDYVVANSMTLKVEESIDGSSPIIDRLI
jgi:hypothetical protein